MSFFQDDFYDEYFMSNFRAAVLFKKCSNKNMVYIIEMHYDYDYMIYCYMYFSSNCKIHGPFRHFRLMLFFLLISHMIFFFFNF